MSLFSTVVSKIPKRNAFGLSFENLLTMEFGELIPVMCKEVLPGDKFRLNTEAIVKTAPMLAPIFSRIDLYMHYFFVPQRLIHEDFEEFITTGIDGLSTELLPPTIKLQDLIKRGANLAEVEDGSLLDYFNIPKISVAQATASEIQDMPINVCPFLAYQKIYSDWYKDELLDSFEFEAPTGGFISAPADIAVITAKRYRSWAKDYFTSARPNTQLGAPVTIPVAGELKSDGPFRLAGPDTSSMTAKTVTTGLSTTIENVDGKFFNSVNVNGGTQLEFGDGITLDSAGVTINDLRRAIRLQEWQERNMRGGNRYIENIFHHFGVKSSDARLQRSELLGGRKCPIVVSEVTQTSATDPAGTSTPLGQLSGKGTSISSTGRIKFFAEEHGYLICIASIMPKAGYMQGLPRMYWRQSYLDYAWPLFGNLGEQEVFAGELYLNQRNPDKAFGYQSRYAEYKFSSNEVHGAFRSSMAYWHNYRIFDNAPNLNLNFIHLNGGANNDSGVQPQNRIFPTLPDGYGHFYVHLYHNIKVLRSLPKYGIPSI